ncbi:transcriptional regulator, AraC family [Lutibacter oricola]|uniref:Transcriptional regulator, AraC family n=1 Tax=Lutibacter oricola TaxID=762486 RepID=A0A1H2QWL0_9FLAO|nr:AraC family transcriptional regulator [Lutibacter oricola]SDW11566.1 transcriptional regulator, AraC family [Lutibacter oricola]
MARTIIENIVILRYEKMTAFEFCQYTSIRFFEILHFEEGEGTIKVNGNEINYRPNCLFIFVPDDIYIVEAKTPTTTTAIKFLKSFFNGSSKNNSNLPVNNWFRNIEGILCNENHQLRALEFQSDVDKISLASLIGIVQKEYSNKQSNNLLIIENTLSIILQIIARNMRVIVSEKETASKSSKIQEIINYIHQNIYQPELLTNKAIAEKFFISENYLNQYFKKNIDMSIKKYKLNYKLKLVENRLKYTDLHFSEIASEFGFTDSSHLNKTFLAYKGLTLGSFKANLA